MANFIRADAHFHPKVNSFNAQAKSFAILQNCVKCGINALVCNDHIYDNPKDSFKILYLMQQQFLNQYPQFKNTFLFPGIECKYSIQSLTGGWKLTTHISNMHKNQRFLAS